MPVGKAYPENPRTLNAGECQYSACDKLEEANELYKEWTGKDLDWSMVSVNNYLVVAKDGDKVVGAAQVVVIPDQVWGRRWGLVENVYVLKQYRRLGIGKGLMKFIETEILASGWCGFIKLTSRKEEGKALYRSVGYEEGLSFRKER